MNKTLLTLVAVLLGCGTHAFMRSDTGAAAGAT